MNIKYNIIEQLFILFLILTIATGCKDNSPNATNDLQNSASDANLNTPSQNFGIVLHGGSGSMEKGKMSPELEAEYTAKLSEAIKTGYDILEKGGSSLEAIEKTINILEDSPLFNAGKGAVFTNDKRNELDASIMDGKTLNSGAIASVTTIKNPITLASAVMQKSEHVMLAGKGAETFAVEQGFELVSPSYFQTERRLKAIERILEREKASGGDNPQAATYNPPSIDEKFGTVGCVALDKNGNLAAGTSTGGRNNKKWGRIGDSPIIGAGTYANNKTCAVSSTGWGEFFIRGVVAYDISALMEYKGLSLKAATDEVVQNKLAAMGGSGGVIAIDNEGNMSMEFNTKGMYRASMNKKNGLYVGMYGN